MLYKRKMAKIDKALSSFLCVLLSILLVFTLLPKIAFAEELAEICEAALQQPESQAVDNSLPDKTYSINYISNEVSLEKTNAEFSEGSQYTLDEISFNNKSLKFLGWSLSENDTSILIADAALIDEQTQVSAKIDGQDSLIKLSDYADESSTINLFAQFTKIQSSVANPGATMNKGPISEGQDWDEDYVDMPQSTDDVANRVLSTQKVQKIAIDSNNTEQNDITPFESSSLKWIKLNDESLESGTTSIDDYPEDNIKQRFQFQVDFYLANDMHFDKESIELSFDAQYWFNRAGVKTGTMSLGVPAHPSTASEFAYIYNATDQTYIVTNTKEIEGGRQYSIQFSINDILPQTIVDESSIEFSLELNAKVNGQVYSAYTNNIDATMHTSEHLDDVFSNDGVIYKTWDQACNSGGCTYPEPASSDDYIYVTWYVYAQFYGCKNFSLEVKGELTDGIEGAFILGPDDAVFKLVDNSYIDSWSQIGTSIWAAYPKSAFDEEAHTYALSLKSTWTLTECNDTGTPGKDVKDAENTKDYTTTQSYTVNILWDDDDDSAGIRPKSKLIKVKGRVYSSYPIYDINVTPDEDGNWQSKREDLDANGEYWVDDNIDPDAFYRYKVEESDAFSVTIKATYYIPQYVIPNTTQKYVSSINRDDYESRNNNDSDLSKLANGDDATDINIEYSLETVAVEKTLGDNLDPGQESSYGKKSYEVIQAVNGLNLESVGQLGEGDYAIRKFELFDNVYYKLIQEPGFEPTKQAVSIAESDHQDIYIYAQAEGEEEASVYAKAVWNSALGSYDLSTDISGCTITGNTVVFPPSKNIFNVYLKTSTSLAGINTKYKVTLDVLSTDSIKNKVYNILSSTDYARKKLSANITHSLFDNDGNQCLSQRESISGTLHGRISKNASRLFTNISQSPADQERKNIPLHFQQDFVFQTNLDWESEYLYMVNNGELPDFTQGINTWYTLLPKGVVADLSSLTVQEGDSIVSIDAFDNYRDSGRTMLICKTKNSLHLMSSDKGTAIASLFGYQNVLQIKFDAIYTFTDTAAYKDEIECNCAFESCTDTIGSVKNYIGEPDNPRAGNHIDSKSAIYTEELKDIFTALDDNHQAGSNNFVYSKQNFTVQVDLMFGSGFTKEASVDETAYYSTSDTVVHEGQGYNYRLTYTVNDEPDGSQVWANDLVFIDKLEDYDSPASDWHGYFNYVNLQKLYEYEIDPVVYVNTESTYAATAGLFDTDLYGNYVDENKKPETDPEFLGKFALKEGWKKLDENTDYSQIKAIAVDATHKEILEDGTYAKDSQFVLDSKNKESTNEISIDVHMYAPAGSQIPDGVYQGDGYNSELNGHAYNKSYMNLKLVNSVGTISKKGEEAITQADACKVGIVKMDTNVRVNINDDNNRDGYRPNTVTFSLCNKEREVLETKSDVPIPENGIIDLSFIGFSSWEAGKYINYIVTQEADEGHPNFLDQYETTTAYVVSSKDNARKYIIEDKHTPETTSIYGDIIWQGDEDQKQLRPTSFFLNLIDCDGNVLKKTQIFMSADGTWNYEFSDVYKYENGGDIAKYSLLSILDSYKTSYTEQKFDEEGKFNVDVINTYHPYDNLIISQKEYLDATPKAKEKKFEFSVELKQGTQILAQLFDYEIRDVNFDIVETGKYSNGNKLSLGQSCQLIIKDIPTKATYSVYQHDLPGFSKEDIIGDQGEILCYVENNAVYYNRYSSFIDFAPKVKIVLNNHELAKYQFKVEWRQNMFPAPASKLLRIGSNGQSVKDEGNSWSAFVNYAPIQITNFDVDETGVYQVNYLMYQQPEEVPGYTYDTALKSKNVNFWDQGDGTFTTDDSVLTYTNTYNANGSYSPKAWVSLQDGSLELNQFSFELSKLKEDEDNTFVLDDSFTPIEKYNLADGTIDFEQSAGVPAISLTETDIGNDYYYIINQTNMTDDFTYVYDTSIKAFKLSVTDNNDGTLSVTTKDVAVSKDADGKYSIDESVDAGMPVFSNKYSPGDLEIHNLWAPGADQGPDPYIERDYHVVLSGENLPDSIDYTIESATPGLETSNNDNITSELEATNTKVSESNYTQSKGASENDNAFGIVTDAVEDGLNSVSNAISEAAHSVSNVLSAFAIGNVSTQLTADLDHIKCEFSTDEDGNGILTFTAVAGEITPTETCWDATANETKTYSLWAKKASDYYTASNKHTKVIIDESCQYVSITNATYYFSGHYAQTGINEFVGLEFLNTSNCVSMFEMFYCVNTIEELNLSNFDTSHVTDMSYMFSNCHAIKSLDLSNFDTSNVTTMTYMFSTCKAIESLDLSNFDTSNVTDMSYMFRNCVHAKSINVASFNTSNVTNLGGMFNGCCSLESIDVSNFDTSKISTVSDVFSNCSNLEKIDISNFVWPGSTMYTFSSTFGTYESSVDPDFKYCHLKYLDMSSYPRNSYGGEWSSKYINELETLIVSDVYAPIADYCKTALLSSCPNLVGQNGTTADQVSGTNWGFDLPGKPGLFWTKDFTVYDSEDGSLTFYGCEKPFSAFEDDRYTIYATPSQGFATANDVSWKDHKTDIKHVSFDSTFHSSYIRSCKNWFNGLSNDDLSFDFTNFDTSSVTDMSYMFSSCSKIENIELSSFNTSNVTDMSNMFAYSAKLKSVDVSNFDMSKVTTTNCMFYNCSLINNIDTSKWNLASVSNIDSMFENSYTITSLDLSGAFSNNTLTSANNVFNGCNALEYVDLSNNTININLSSSSNKCNYWFNVCRELKSCNFENTKIKFKNINNNAPSNWFSTCSKLTDINFKNSEFSIEGGNPQKFSAWFSSCTSLESIDISNFKVGTLTDGFFSGASKLKSITLGTDNYIDGGWAITTPSGAGYTGKWCKADFTVTGVENLANKYNEDKNVFAGEWIWEPAVENPYSITYDANGGAGSMGMSMFSSSESAKLPACTFQKFNCSFAGWKDESNDCSYANEDTIPANTYSSGDTITLKAQWTQNSSGGTITDNEFDISIPASGKAVIKDLPAGTTYNIYQKDKTGYYLVSSSDTIGSIGVKEVPDSLTASYTKTSSAKFYNRYSQATPVSTSVSLSATVNLDNKPASEGLFTFQSDFSGVKTVSNSIAGMVNFGSETYASEGSHTYYVKQVIGSDPFIKYDNTQYTVTVTITKDEESGDLVSSTVFNNGTSECDKIVFNNQHLSGNIDFANIVSKDSEVSDPDFEYQISFSGVSALGIEKLRYTLPDSSKGDLDVTNGKASFTMKKNSTISFNDIPHGVNFEISAVSTPAGWTQSDKSGLSGTIVGGNLYEASMTYVYGQNATVDINAWVYLKNGTLEESQFKFDLLNSEHKSILPTDLLGTLYVKNDAPDLRQEINDQPNINYLSAPISFNNYIQIPNAGTYTFYIQQIDIEAEGISCDVDPCTVTIIATDRGDGTYATTTTLDYGNPEKTRFINEIEADCNLHFVSLIKDGTGNSVANAYPISYKFDLSDKKGKQLIGEYDYTITNVDKTSSEGTMLSGDVIELCNNQTIDIKLPVDTSYRVYSVDLNPAFTVYSYDNVLYANQTASQGTVVKDQKNANGSCVQEYSASGSIKPVAKVSFTSAKLLENQFSFNIVDCATGASQTVSNDASGNINFDVLNFIGAQAGSADEPCVYTYEFTQNIGDSQTITYDSQKYTAQVTVVDSEANGVLECAIKYYNEAGSEVDAPMFTNVMELNDLPDTGKFGLVQVIGLAVALFGLFMYLIRRNRNVNKKALHAKHSVLR